jgi:branched-chain amino acid transport system ATP-binding protein
LELHKGPELKTVQLNAWYGPSHVLQGVDLDVEAGRITAVVGRNGVGKTTLLGAIMGLVPAVKGEILLNGLDLAKLPGHARRRLGMALVPQGRRLFSSLTVEEHLRLAQRGIEGTVSLEDVYRWFPQLYARRKAIARSLSGGEQSMLSLARALVTSPRVLLMDEPTEGLAPILVEAVKEITVDMKRRGLTVLLVEQNLRFVLEVADTIAVMHRGAVTRLYDRGTLRNPDELAEHILLG